MVVIFTALPVSVWDSIPACLKWFDFFFFESPDFDDGEISKDGANTSMYDLFMKVRHDCLRWWHGGTEVIATSTLGGDLFRLVSFWSDVSFVSSSQHDEPVF